MSFNKSLSTLIGLTVVAMACGSTKCQNTVNNLVKPKGGQLSLDETYDLQFLDEEVDVETPTVTNCKQKQVIINPKQDWDVNPMLPTKDEQLESPINIEDCPIVITEWRSSDALTGKSKEGLDVLSSLCKSAMKLYPLFIKEEKPNLVNKINKKSFKTNLSLIPWDYYGSAEGKEPRNLNDTTERFKHRTRLYLDCKETYIYGYYARNSNYVFMRNDIAHSMAAQRTFVHELFHVINYNYGVYDKLSDSQNERLEMEEVLADKFEGYVLKERSNGSE